MHIFITMTLIYTALILQTHAFLQYKSPRLVVSHAFEKWFDDRKGYDILMLRNIMVKRHLTRKSIEYKKPDY